jgi:hypothetical protein
MFDGNIQKARIYGWALDNLGSSNIEYKVAQEKLNAILKAEGITDTGSDEENIKTALAKIAKDKEDALKGLNGSNKNKNKTTKTPIGDNPFGDAAAPAGGAATTGGLGSSKTITMNFNQPLMQITAGSIDGEDLQGDAEKVIEQLTFELMQMSATQTSV